MNLTTKTMMALAVLAAVVVPSPPADACVNELMLSHDEAVIRISVIEFHLGHEQHWQAFQAMPAAIDYVGDGKAGFDPSISTPLEQRFRDAEALLELRFLPRERRDRDYQAYVRDIGDATRHFFERVWDNPTSPKLRAWLAEASAAIGTWGHAETGKSRALEILRDLDRRDLMPDGNAWGVLVRLSHGEEWVAAREKCHARALVKSVCALSASEI